MTDIKDILRHRHGLGLPRAQIAAAVGVSAGTVSHVLDRASAAGLSWPLPGNLDDEALRERLYPTPGRDSGHVQPDWDEVIEALQAPRKRRRARLTRLQLWKEYRDEALAQGGSAYSYSRFCARLKARLKDSGNAGPAQMRFDYAPGLYGLSDFSGKVLAVRTGRGEKDVEIFVAVLAHSRLIYSAISPNSSPSRGRPSIAPSSGAGSLSVRAGPLTERTPERILKGRWRFWTLALLWLPAGVAAQAFVRFGAEPGPVGDPGIAIASLFMMPASLVPVAACGLPLALGCRRLRRLGYRRGAWVAGVVLGALTTAASVLAGLLGPIAIALFAVVLSGPVWAAWFWLRRRR